MKISLNPEKVEVVDGDYTNSNYWRERISESNYFNESDRFILIKSEKDEINVDFDLDVVGSNFYDPGDYYTPPYYESEINSVDINLKMITINDIEVKITKELNEKVVNLIKTII